MAAGMWPRRGQVVEAPVQPDEAVESGQPLLRVADLERLLARQLAGDAGVKALGTDALSTPPGTTALANVFAAANAPVLIFLDEALNFPNRHRGFAQSFHAFIQNLTVSITGTTQGVADYLRLSRSTVYELAQFACMPIVPFNPQCLRLLRDQLLCCCPIGMNRGRDSCLRRRSSRPSTGKSDYPRGGQRTAVHRWYPGRSCRQGLRRCSRLSGARFREDT